MLLLFRTTLWSQRTDFLYILGQWTRSILGAISRIWRAADLPRDMVLTSFGMSKENLRFMLAAAMLPPTEVRMW